MQSVDVAIVGGGMAGAALALSLAKAGRCQVTLIEKHAAPVYRQAKAPLDSRVVALNATSLEWLAALDVLTHVPDKAFCPYQAMQVWDGEGSGSVGFDAASEHADSLGAIVENHALVYALWQALQQYSNVQIITGCAVTGVQTGSPLKITLDDGQALKAGLVVAADGANSPVREQIGFSVDSYTYDQMALVATLHVEKPHGHCAYQRFSQTGPLALLPLPSEQTDAGEAHYCALVWSQAIDAATDLQALDDPAFAAAISRASEGVLGNVIAVHHRQSLPLAARHATRYFQDGVALIADAAHTIHPLAGQGINLGFADASALSAELLRAFERDLALNEPSIYRRYERQRRSHNQIALWAMQGIKTGFELADPAAVVARNVGMRLFNRSGWLKKYAVKFAQGRL